MQTIYLFDFDGTLTSRDSLLRILRYGGSKWKMLVAAFFVVPMILVAKLKLFDSGKVKERLLSFYFKGWPLSQFETVCKRFAEADQWIWREKAVEFLRQRRANGDRCIVVTASIDSWVRPFIDKVFPEMELIATKMETKDGRLTGRFLTPNCRCEEKVRRIQQVIKSEMRQDYHIVAFGDSSGDSEMLAYADEPNYKTFE